MNRVAGRGTADRALLMSCVTVNPSLGACSANVNNASCVIVVVEYGRCAARVNTDYYELSHDLDIVSNCCHRDYLYNWNVGSVCL